MQLSLSHFFLRCAPCASQQVRSVGPSAYQPSALLRLHQRRSALPCACRAALQVRFFGYPDHLYNLKFDWTYMCRGLIIDKKRGNMLKVGVCWLVGFDG